MHYVRDEASDSKREKQIGDLSDRVSCNLKVNESECSSYRAINVTECMQIQWQKEVIGRKMSPFTVCKIIYLLQTRQN